MNREPTDQIWDLVQHFMMYDPITVLASVPNMREQFFKGRKLANNGCVHEIIGLSKFETGVTEVDNLRAALVRLLLQGLARNTMVENAVTLENAEANDALTGKLGGDDDGEDGIKSYTKSDSKHLGGCTRVILELKEHNTDKDLLKPAEKAAISNRKNLYQCLKEWKKQEKKTLQWYQNTPLLYYFLGHRSKKYTKDRKSDFKKKVQEAQPWKQNFQSILK